MSLPGRFSALFLSALGLVLGVSLGLWLRDALALMPGESTWNNLPWAALGAMWVGLAATTAELHRYAIWFLRGATVAATAWFVIPPQTNADIFWLAPIFAAVILALWFILEPLTAEPPGGAVLFALALAFLAAGAVLIHASSARQVSRTTFPRPEFLNSQRWIGRRSTPFSVHDLPFRPTPAWSF